VPLAGWLLDFVVAPYAMPAMMTIITAITDTRVRSDRRWNLRQARLSRLFRLAIVCSVSLLQAQSVADVTADAQYIFDGPAL
jgi:hypothetical protein